MEIDASQLRLLKDKVLVTKLEFGEQILKSGIIIKDDDFKEHGIRPRYAKVYRVGPDVTDIEVGDYVLLKHARWTHGIPVTLDGKPDRVWMIDYPDAVLLVRKDKPSELDIVGL